MTSPSLLRVADIAKRTGRPTWWVRRALKALAKRQPGSVVKVGRFYETTAGTLAELSATMSRAVNEADMPDEPGGDCPHCAGLRAEVAELEQQLVEMAGRLARATPSDR
jgi:uncharacterized protein YceH (UPF0502 family)